MTDNDIFSIDDIATVPSIETPLVHTISNELLCKLFSCVQDTTTAIELLNATGGQCIKNNDAHGNTTLMRSMQHDINYSLALIPYSEHNIQQKNNKGHTALYYATKYDKEQVVYRLLDYDQEINWNTLCKQSWTRCVIKGLRNKISLHTLSQLYDNKTVLMKACDDKLETIALSILDHPLVCNMAHAHTYKGTALMIACDNGLETVAMKMLNTPTLCNLSHTGSLGDALVLAARNKLSRVVCAISLAMNTTVDTELKSTMDKYQMMRDFNAKYEQELEKNNTCGTCLCCSTENSIHYIALPCSHTTNICPECYPKITQCNSCAVCKCSIQSFNRTFVVT
jgi:hypothetical protein